MARVEGSGMAGPIDKLSIHAREPVTLRLIGSNRTSSISSISPPTPVMATWNGAVELDAPTLSVVVSVTVARFMAELNRRLNVT